MSGSCEEETLKDFQHFGYTWTHGNLMNYGGGNGAKPKFGFSFLANSFYVD